MPVLYTVPLKNNDELCMWLICLSDPEEVANGETAKCTLSEESAKCMLKAANSFPHPLHYKCELHFTALIEHNYHLLFQGH